MARPLKRFVCQSCGSVTTKWSGRCESCGEWNTITEEAGAAPGPAGAMLSRGQGGKKGRLLEFTGLTEDPAVRAFFESETPADRAHAGRWRSGVPPERLAAFEEHHDRLAADLLARGRPYRPVILDPSPELAAARS